MPSLSMSVSDPVDIPTTKNNLKNNHVLFSTDEAYMVTSNIFDPYRSSPPNNWNTRLKNRLALFTDKNDTVGIGMYGNKNGIKVCTKPIRPAIKLKKEK